MNANQKQHLIEAMAEFENCPHTKKHGYEEISSEVMEGYDELIVNDFLNKQGFKLLKAENDYCEEMAVVKLSA